MNDRIQLSAKSFETLALNEPLRFPVPEFANDQSRRDESLYFWKLLQFSFQVQDPASFPAFSRDNISADDVEVLHRFIDTARTLANSILLQSNAQVTITLDDETGEPTVEQSDFPPKEVVVGVATLFRQCFTPDEPASFKAVYNRLERINRAEPGDADYETRAQMLRSWRAAQGQLRALSLLEHVGEELVRRGEMSDGGIPRLHDLNPEQLISLYIYGDLIHWGDKRQALAVFGAEADLTAVRELDFLKVITSLIHFYAGFAVMIEAAMAEYTPDGTGDKKI